MPAQTPWRRHGDPFAAADTSVRTSDPRVVLRRRLSSKHHNHHTTTAAAGAAAAARIRTHNTHTHRIIYNIIFLSPSSRRWCEYTSQPRHRVTLRGGRTVSHSFFPFGTLLSLVPSRSLTLSLTHTHALPSVSFSLAVTRCIITSRCLAVRSTD